MPARAPASIDIFHIVMRASMDGRERRAQLMGDVADEFRLAFLLDVQVKKHVRQFDMDTLR